MCPILAAASRAPRRVISLNGVPGPRVSPRPATATPITGLKVQHYFNSLQIWSNYKESSGVLLKKYKVLEVYFVWRVKKYVFGPKRSMHNCVWKPHLYPTLYVKLKMGNFCTVTEEVYFLLLTMKYWVAPLRRIVLNPTLLWNVRNAINTSNNALHYYTHPWTHQNRSSKMFFLMVDKVKKFCHNIFKILCKSLYLN